MLRTAEEAALIMEQRYPQIVDCLGNLAAADVRCSLVGSRVAEHAALMLGVDGIRPADDWDLQILASDFMRAVEITNARVAWGKYIDAPTGDKRRMRLIADDARAKVGPYSIQFMRPHTPVVIGGARYLTSYTDLVDTAAEQYGCLRFSHLTETLTLYGLRQAGLALRKDDLTRAALATAISDPGANLYTDYRTAEIGWDGRLRAFRTAAARQAQAYQRIPVAA